MTTPTETILVIDDDLFSRTLLTTNLEEEGYTVEAAENGRQGLDMLRARSFDLVLLDLLMPEMDGFEVLKWMKAETTLQPIPVIVISGEEDTESVVRCIEMGATDYLPKPFDPVLLHTRVKNALLAAKRFYKSEAYTGTICVVDDDMFNRTLLATNLEEEGYTVELAENGRQAIDMLYDRPSDAVLLDLLMPEMDGFEVLKIMKADARLQHIPVIVISGEEDIESVVRCIEMGAEDYLPKPFDPVLLRARIHSCLEKKRLRDLEREQRAELEAQRIELKKKNAQLQELNASKDKFFSIISHDLRSPFNTILGYAQLITANIDGYNQEELKNRVEKLRASAERLYALLENLLTWSRMQRGAMPYEPEDLDLYELAEENIAIFESKAELKEITLTSSIQEHTLAYADFSMVNTVLRNLISNALKFTDAGGSITVSAVALENNIEVAVADTGQGIDADGLTQLFRIDTQYTNVGTAGETGTGLGLILCQDLVERNGGRIWVESEVGKGTTFRFTLPMSVK